MKEVGKQSRAVPELKHMGALLEPTGTNQMEIAARISAANKAWTNLGRLLVTSAPWRVKRQVRVGLIYGAAI